MKNLIKKLCNALMACVAMVIVTFSLLIAQANPTFFAKQFTIEKTICIQFIK